jgi:hypothetical protein
MKNGISEIDHLLTKVEQPELAGAHFESLGFTVTPLSQIESMGVCNRLVLFEPLTEGSANFIELMGVADATHVPASMAVLLKGPPGIRSMVMATPEAHAARAELVANGYAFGEVHHIARDWVLPDKRIQVEFDVLLPVPAPFAFNVCRYFSLQHYTRPEWTKHANGIRHLEAVYCIADNPREAWRYYEDLFGIKATGSDARGWSLSPGKVVLTVFSPQSWQRVFRVAAKPGFAGYRLRSNDFKKTLGYLKSASLQIRVTANGEALIPAGQMFGCFVHVV